MNTIFPGIGTGSQPLKRVSVILSVSLLFSAATCSALPAAKDRYPPKPAIADGPILKGSKVIGHSVQGRPMEALFLGSGTSETILIIASIHGNEWAGTPLVQELVKYLRDEPQLLQGRRLIIVPVVNPDGYTQNVRHNANKVDLNRNYPSENRQNTPRYGMSALSEPESKVIMSLLQEHRPDKMITMHQPFGVVDFDGEPSRKLAAGMAKYSIMPLEHVGSRPGSLGSYLGLDLKVPIVTLELPTNEHHYTAAELWRRHGRSLLSVITYPQPPPIPLSKAVITTSQAYWIHALLTFLLVLAALLLWRTSEKQELPK